MGDPATLQAAFVEQSSVATADLATVAALLSARFSCRAYRPDPVPRDVLERLLSIAQRSASWCNAQPWQVIIASGQGAERFREAMVAEAISGNRGQPDFEFPLGYEGVYGDRKRDAGWGLYAALGIEKGDRESSSRQMLENFRLFGAPHVLFLTTERAIGSYGVLDCGIYLGNLMLTMQAAGIASIAQGAFASFAPFIRDFFGIPQHRRLLVGLSFGYSDPAHAANRFRTNRADLSTVARWVDR